MGRRRRRRLGRSVCAARLGFVGLALIGVACAADGGSREPPAGTADTQGTEETEDEKETTEGTEAPEGTEATEETNDTEGPTSRPEPSTPAVAGTRTGMPPTRPPGQAVVTSVVDGDTLDVRIGRRIETVRLVGINTPEADECWADQAAARLAELVAGRTVVLVRDTSDRDQYGRLLRFVEVDGVDVGEVLVAEGHAIARDYPPDLARSDRYHAAQAAAQEAGVGRWAADACGPSAGPATISITFNANPPGNEAEDLNAEWVRLTNTGAIAIELTGWGIADESSSNRFAFPGGFTLAPGAAVTVRSGCGAATATDLYWCSGRSAIWNNSGDTAFVLDPHGNTVASASYG